MKYLILVCFLWLPLSVQGDIRRNNEPEERLYQLDTQRALDMAKAYSELAAMLDKDHFIHVIFKDSGDSYKKFGVTKLTAQGTMVTLKLVHVDDDDRVKGLSIRAREIERLELDKKPW